MRGDRNRHRGGMDRKRCPARAWRANSSPYSLALVRNRKHGIRKGGEKIERKILGIKWSVTLNWMFPP